MTNEDFAYLGDYIRDLANEIGLHDWELQLSSELPQEVNDEEGAASAAACIDVVYGRRHATVSLCREFVEFEPKKQIHYLSHELSHLFFDDLESIVRATRSMMGEMAWNGVWSGYHLAWELAVDNVAKVIARVAPPLRLPSGRRKRSARR